MPIFEFECAEGHISEELQKSPQDSITCNCGKEAKRIVSRFRYTNSPEFQKRYHPEEVNQEKELAHYSKKIGKPWWDTREEDAKIAARNKDAAKRKGKKSENKVTVA